MAFNKKKLIVNLDTLCLSFTGFRLEIAALLLAGNFKGLY